MDFESFVLSFAPFIAFEASMFVLIYIVARAILLEEHGQQQREAEAGEAARREPDAPARKLAA